MKFGGFLLRSRWMVTGAVLGGVVAAGSLMTASAADPGHGNAIYVPVTPCRIMDTRPAPDGVGPRNSALSAQETYSIAVRGTNGHCTIPGEAAGLSLNVTVANPTDASYLTVFPSDAVRPLASSLNWSADQAPVANAVTTSISADGKVSFFNNAGMVDVIVDVVGYYVGHDHDDRYYTKAEIDNTFYTKTEIDNDGHALPLDVYQMRVPADLGQVTPDSPYGVLVAPANGSNALYLSTTMPPDLTPNSTVTLQVYFAVAAENCVVSLKAPVYHVSRPGVVDANGSQGITPSVGTFPAPSPSFATGVAPFTLDLPGGGGLRPGDAVRLRIDRASGDTCGGMVTIVGAQLVYT